MGVRNSRPDIPKLPMEMLEELAESHYIYFCTQFHARIDQFVNMAQVSNITALRYNPFKKNIVELFCSDPESGSMSFRDFLEMCSVFSRKAPREAKIVVIYLLFTSSSMDNLIRQSDVENVLARFVGEQMKTSSDIKDQKDITSIAGAADCVMREADIDNSGEVSYKEFQRLGRSKRNEDMLGEESGEVFGKDLRERIDEERKIYQDPSIMIPTIVKFLVDFLREAPPRQGIFREVGSVLNVSNYRSKVNEYGTKPVDYRSLFKHELTPNDASSLLKSYFRYLPEPLVTFNGYDRLVVIGQTELDDKNRISKLKTMVEGLPTVNYETLKYFIDLLFGISTRGVYNMDANNLAVCLNPSICFAKDKESSESFLNLNYVITSLSSMIKNYPQIFDQNIKNDQQQEPISEPKVIVEKKVTPPPSPKLVKPQTQQTQHITNRTPSKLIDKGTSTPKYKSFDEDFQDTILQELDRLDSKIDFRETELELERDLRKSGRMDDYGYKTFLDTKKLNTSEMFKELEQAESTETLGEDDDLLLKRRNFHSNLSIILPENEQDSFPAHPLLASTASPISVSATIPQNDQETKRLMELIRQLQNENSQLRKNQTEMFNTIEKLQNDGGQAKLGDEMERVKAIANHEIQQIRKYIYNVEEQTIEELKHMWTKMDHLEDGTKQALLTSDPGHFGRQISHLKDEIKNMKLEIRDIYGGFGEINERMKSIEIDYREINSRIDDVLKEERFIKARHDYDLEHLKRLVEESNSRIRQMGLEITTIRSRVDSKYSNLSSPTMTASASSKLASPQFTTTANMEHRTTSHIATNLPISKYKY
ncbi:rho GTPase activating protein [Naegleria gruberi]|uniref:Rho GTPase activating protein n=1 Tax=Naegleria gruberi TaxID=5762 RepID=D2V3F2_NAEGR|nr:rho GTPase activating protein [Naegleria gruberi]EFC48627.1 rho GTPase activating protein [Naegleria gruberi]|eukprot:XP_002681371.1 rho GTPase activating protein [Naegleria gruberi strain NEG-M]